MLLYGDISSYSWYEDDITPAAFNDELKSLEKCKNITVRINSGGGDVYAATAIFTRLKDHAANITVKIDGWCCSAATIIAMAGDTVEISAGGVFMIHDPAAGLLGYYNAEELEKVQSRLETIKQSIINTYMLRTEKTEEEIKELMTAETWLTADEAVDMGFCDSVMFTEVETEIEEDTAIVNNIPINLNAFTTIPKGLLDGNRRFNNKTNAEKTEKEGKIKMTLDELKKNFPEIANAFRNEVLAEQAAAGEKATKEAVDKERARIKAIDDCTLPGFEDLANKAKYEDPITAEAFAMQIIAAQKAQGQTFLNDREADVNDSGAADVTPDSNTGKDAAEDNTFIDIIDRIFPGK